MVKATNPTNVESPVTFIEFALMPPVNVAAVPVMMLSVDATPVNHVPSPEKDVALTRPTTFSPALNVGAPVPALFV